MPLEAPQPHFGGAQCADCQLADALRAFPHGGREVARGPDDEFTRVRRRRGAHVGHEVGDRHVGLVPHARDDRHWASGDGAGDGFLVERHQVFERAAAAARDDDEVGRRDAVIRWRAVTIEAAAASPCTRAGEMTTCIRGARE